MYDMKARSCFQMGTSNSQGKHRTSSGTHIFLLSLSSFSLRIPPAPLECFLYLRTALHPPRTLKTTLLAIREALMTRMSNIRGLDKRVLLQISCLFSFLLYFSFVFYFYSPHICSLCFSISRFFILPQFFLLGYLWILFFHLWIFPSVQIRGFVFHLCIFFYDYFVPLFPICDPFVSTIPNWCMITASAFLDLHQNTAFVVRHFNPLNSLRQVQEKIPLRSGPSCNTPCCILIPRTNT